MESATDKSADNQENKDPLQNYRFRNLGPAVGGGRITSVVGVPGKPNIYYAGAAGGGVFFDLIQRAAKDVAVFSQRLIRNMEVGAYDHLEGGGIPAGFHRHLFYTGMTRANETVRVACDKQSQSTLAGWLVEKA